MNGNAPDSEHEPEFWYPVHDEMTGEPKGFITSDGRTRDMDNETKTKIENAFGKDLMVQEDEVVEELGGVCYGGVCTVTPNDPGHNRMVLQNLGALTGLRPSQPEEAVEESGTPDAE